MNGDISQADIMRAFLQASLDYGQPKMAGKLDIQVSTLSNKVQPYDHEGRRHYLNLWEADNILTASNDMRPLELLAARHGFILLPMKAEPDAPTFEAEALQDVQEYAEYLAENDPVKRIHKINSYFRNVLETEARRREEKVMRGAKQ